MKRKTGIYVAVVGVGLTALVIDRCFVGTTAPQTTSAEEVESDTEAGDLEQQSSPSRRRPAALALTGKIAVPELHFPRDLPTLDTTMQMRDLFERPGSKPAQAPQQSNGTETGEGMPGEAIGRAAFAGTHKVEAVFVQDSLKIAVVDGRWMRVGEKIDDCTLIQIEGDAATFQCHDGVTELSPARKTASPSVKD